MSGHTPGPWEVEPRGRTVHVKGDQSRRIADVRGWGCLGYLPDGAAIQDANARLIAASPVLLRACRSTLAQLRAAVAAGTEDLPGFDVEQHVGVIELREAIALAEKVAP